MEDNQIVKFTKSVLDFTDKPDGDKYDFYRLEYTTLLPLLNIL